MSYSRFRATLLVLVIALSLGANGCMMAARAAYREYHKSQVMEETFAEADARVDPSKLPSDIRIVRDVPYGDEPRQRLDVYAPKDAQHGPVIFMVHGGAWAVGDKAMRRVVENKVRRWVPKGFVFISVDYPMLPGTPVRQQAVDIAKALAFAQKHAAEWGADRSSFVLMGHSAGAHLIALITASPSFAHDAGAEPWLASVMLDSAAYDVDTIMRAKHLALYDRAFGKDPARWREVSPTALLLASTAPILAVCSSRRADSCAQADAFVHKASALGTQGRVLREDLSHGDINALLGEPSSYTTAVDDFLRTLGPSVAMHLAANR